MLSICKHNAWSSVITKCQLKCPASFIKINSFIHSLIHSLKFIHSLKCPTSSMANGAERWNAHRLACFETFLCAAAGAVLHVTRALTATKDDADLSTAVAFQAKQRPLRHVVLARQGTLVLLEEQTWRFFIRRSVHSAKLAPNKIVDMLMAYGATGIRAFVIHSHQRVQRKGIAWVRFT